MSGKLWPDETILTWTGPPSLSLTLGCLYPHYYRWQGFLKSTGVHVARLQQNSSCVTNICTKHATNTADATTSPANTRTGTCTITCTITRSTAATTATTAATVQLLSTESFSSTIWHIYYACVCFTPGTTTWVCQSAFRRTAEWIHEWGICTWSNL
jgi:hypothetical protein